MLAPGMDLLAMLYSGHQFEVHVPQLGDAVRFARSDWLEGMVVEGDIEDGDVRMLEL